MEHDYDALVIERPDPESPGCPWRWTWWAVSQRLVSRTGYETKERAITAFVDFDNFSRLADARFERELAFSSTAGKFFDDRDGFFRTLEDSCLMPMAD